MSTGRCSTQFLAQVLAETAPDCVIEHEPIRYEYMPRKVFRQPREFKRALGANVIPQRKLIQIDDILAAENRYVDVGWPTFAWLPYLSGRFGEKLEFGHLVRNPFYCATSMVTQGFFTGGSANYVRTAIIHATDPKVAFPRFAAAFDSYTPFEKCLYHWLELNRFVLDFHRHRSFRGLFKFEDLYCGDGSTLDAFASAVLGKEIRISGRAAHDLVNKKTACTNQPA